MTRLAFPQIVVPGTVSQEATSKDFAATYEGTVKPAARGIGIVRFTLPILAWDLTFIVPIPAEGAATVPVYVRFLLRKERLAPLGAGG